MLKVNYGTGAGNYESNLDIDDLAVEVGNNTSYTQCNVKIQDMDGETLAILNWYGVKATEDDTVTADYGDFGFYGEWERV